MTMLVLPSKARIDPHDAAATGTDRDQNSRMTRKAGVLSVCQSLCQSSHPARLIRATMREKHARLASNLA